MKRGLRLAAVAATSVGAAALAPIGAAAATTVAAWGMDEGAHATTMTDSVGTANGSIGTDVVTGVSTGSSRGYQFPKPPSAARRDSHLVLVQDRAALDPGSGNFSFTVRVKTGAGNQNIMQKGQANIAGGYYKVDEVRGFPICLFRDSGGATSAKRGSKTIWDGAWHTITCSLTRGDNSVRITVDGATSTPNRKALGNIDNSKPLSIGGKVYCSPPAVGCDYFVGTIDSASISKG